MAPRASPGLLRDKAEGLRKRPLRLLRSSPLPVRPLWTQQGARPETRWPWRPHHSPPVPGGTLGAALRRSRLRARGWTRACVYSTNTFQQWPPLCWSPGSRENADPFPVPKILRTDKCTTVIAQKSQQEVGGGGRSGEDP